MSTQRLLQVLAQQIAALAAEVTPRGDVPIPQARFDAALFANRGTRLRDYLAEVEKNFAQLQSAATDNRTSQVAFLAEKLVAQISALQRELATQALRRKNQPKEAPEADLYHKLAEHQDYERRLIAMIQDRESLLGRQTTLAAQQKLQHELAALEGRLMRCRQALARIERNIERKENGF
ncbi:primosomal replication protein PriC [Serratia marcescens]|uniref:primosomal replication protein PriC n=1 Tax=Serratia marcescens TaxID=615 RepID=UPI0011817253|nr:primosomal replication protein [Serratia marcescens]MBN5316911.1 primosomal replication protein [Serratia marcescens]TSB29085.1 prephenate dehydrogenase [Serratia marcescens]TXE48841.1 prephenate dehydrogenase [Serratia marcescens]HCR2991586.1 primosomal replication protein [Serratia marcescens]HCR2996626.1 primosomal replication protein [Serratia marcescens]